MPVRFKGPVGVDGEAFHHDALSLADGGTVDRGQPELVFGLGVGHRHRDVGGQLGGDVEVVTVEGVGSG